MQYFSPLIFRGVSFNFFVSDCSFKRNFAGLYFRRFLNVVCKRNYKFFSIIFFIIDFFLQNLE